MKHFDISDVYVATLPAPSLAEEKRASEELGEEQRRWRREVLEEGQQLREHRIKLTRKTVLLSGK